MSSYTLPFKPSDRVLELGGGNKPVFHPNLDIKPLPNVDIVANLERLLPIGDESYDGVYSAYAIEHISWRWVKRFVSEVHRILRLGGTAVFVTANLKEQAKVIAGKGAWDGSESCMIFGDQDYPENIHKCGFSPEYAGRLFGEAGFERVEIKPHPDCSTDMIIEALKARRTNPNAHPFTREYFEGGGYARFYRDFPVHYKTAEIMLKRNPESVLEVGGARGYICKLLKNKGIRTLCMDISEHCYHTRAIEDFVLHDATKTPWPFEDREFDLAFSIAFLEHIPEKKVDVVIRELARVSKRGLHGITFTRQPSDIDKTHRTIRPKDWWIDKFKTIAPDYSVEIMNKEDMERGPIKLPESDGLVKLNIGCFQDMFHYGWENWDVLDLSDFAKANGYRFEQIDVTKEIPKPDGLVDIILCSHFLEHLTREQGLAFLKECRRALKPDGLIRLAVPDARLLSQKYVKGEIMEYRHVNVGVERATDGAEALFHLLLAGHQTIYDEGSLKQQLEKAGFAEIERMPFNKSRSEVIEKQCIDLYPTLSLWMEARPKKEIPPYRRYLEGTIGEGVQ